MRATNRKRALMVSGSVILLCLSIIMGTTYALFTDTDTMKQHLKAGNLDMKLERTAITKKVLNADGYFETVEVDPETAVKDFTNATKENVFELEEDEKIVPQSEYSATMRITNDENNSDVAVGYWIEIKYSGNSAAELAEKILVSVKNVDPALDKNLSPVTVSSGDSLGSEQAPLGVLKVGDNQLFTVTILFDATGDNNELMGDEIEIDIVVHAFQYVVEVTTPAPAP